MTTDADRLARIAVELVVRLRDDNPEANGRWLAAHLPDPRDWFRLAFVLAAAVPDDRPWAHLIAWTGCTSSPSGHRRRGEPVCVHCRRDDRDRKRPAHLTPDRRPA